MGPDNGDINDTYTIGDSHEIECPACKKNICLIDAEIDGCLKEGYEDNCEHCGAKYVITCVDYSATVWARLKK